MVLYSIRIYVYNILYTYEYNMHIVYIVYINNKIIYINKL